MLSYIATFAIIWWLVYRLLGRLGPWSLKAGQIIASEHTLPKDETGALSCLQWLLSVPAIPLVLYWGWVARERASSHQTGLFQALYETASTSHLILAGACAFGTVVGLSWFSSLKKRRAGRHVVVASIRMFETGRVRRVVFREPKRRVWPQNFALELAKKGALVAWQGKRMVVIFAPLHQKRGVHNSYCSPEKANEFGKVLTHHPNSPYLDALEDHKLLQDQARADAAARELALRDAQQRALEAERRRKEAEKSSLERQLTAAYEWSWCYPSGSLLLGTVRANPLDLHQLPVPSHLRAAYDTYTCELPIWFTGQEMGLTFGATGSGKFTSAVANNVMLYDGSCFVIDPKGEVCAVTAGARQNFRNQKVYRLDPFHITEFAPGAYQAPLASYNPLDVLDPRAFDFEDDVKSLVEVLVEMPTTGDLFFANKAKDLIHALILFVCTHPDAAADRTLHKAFEYLNPEPGQLEWLTQEMAASPVETVRLFANSLRDETEKTRSNIWSTARGELSLFVSPAIKAVTSSSSFRFEELLQGGHTLYLVLDASRLDSHNRWLRLMMTVSLMMAVRHKKNGQSQRMLWIVDEAAQLGHNDIIPRAYRLLRGYGVQIWTFWQNLGSLKETYPKGWDSMVANSFVQVLSSGDYDTAKYFCDSAGEHEVEKISTGESHGKSQQTGHNGSSGYSGGVGVSSGLTGSSFSSNTGYSQSSGWSQSESTSFSANTNRSWQWEPRIRVNDVLAMRKDQMYVRFPGEKAGFIGKFHYFTDLQLSALAAANPFFNAQTTNQLQLAQQVQGQFNSLLGFQGPAALPAGGLTGEQALTLQRAEKFQPFLGSLHEIISA